MARNATSTLRSRFPCINGRPSAKPWSPDSGEKARYSRRNVVERGLCQLKHWRRLASHYDRLARNYLGGLSLAALLAWLP